MGSIQRAHILIFMAKKLNTAAQDHQPAPNALLMALEFRAPWELWSVLPSWPALAQAKKGDGHPVIVFPGLSASDGSTLPMRSYLQNLGYDVSGWNQGYNFGPRAGILETAKRQLQDTCDVTGEKVSLIGWSLGGIYARELAKELPHCVRCVITLGTPFAGSHKSTNAWRLYELTSGRDITHATAQFDLPSPPPMPTTSIYSRTDGVVAWSASIQDPQKTNTQTENIEVFASHIGLGLNPTAWWAVADRLAQRPGHWTPFTRSNALQRLIFPRPDRV
jgi:pimeloyl-ACP methyl ester carboxylesterase